MVLLLDTLVVIGMATAQLGTIREADGPREHTFWLRNSGTEAVTLGQGYTSCGCTTIHYQRGAVVNPGDSTAVTLRFNPRGKGGEFEETGTLVYGQNSRDASVKRLYLSLVGTCITSEETLLRQFPVRIDDGLRLSADRLDLGRMRIGETRERSIVVLHRDEGDRQERITIRFTADSQQRGLQHISHPVEITRHGRKQTLTVTLDVFVR